MCIYHYSAKKQDGVQVQTIDGILKCKNEILDMEEYRDAKKLIFQTEDITGIVIISLSQLNANIDNRVDSKWGFDKPEDLLPLDTIKKQYIEDALKTCKYNVKKTAKILEVHVQTIKKFIQL